ncbi:MAG: hypothetical protein KKH92_05000, partial [Firmicutes bacterium]|nr:hypothetical protein [Bacillota bacterium]
MKNTLQNWVWSTRNFFVRLREKLHLNPNLPTWAKALIYLSPALILLAIFTFYPIINAFRLVIYTGYQHVRSVDGTLVESITGYTLFGNFAKVLSADNFIFPSSHTNSSVLLNTLAIVFISVPISILASLFVAATLNSIKPLKSFFQTIFFLPYITNTLAIGLVFAYMFKSGESGIVNQFFMLFGINPVS